MCGAVRFEVDGPFEEMHHCHCSRCRKTHGAAFSTFAQTSVAKFRLLAGADQLRDYRSSKDVRRSFCATCGSSLLFRLDSLPDAVWVAVASLDDDPDLRPQAHIFVGSKANWHEITDTLPQHDAYPAEGQT
ncbi:MAG: GFA family protein [Candidatus Binatia bacterium]